MNKILVLILNDVEVDVMDVNKMQLDERILKEISDTYKRLNISRKENEKNFDDDYSDVYTYDYNKKSSLDVNSYATI